MVWGRKGPAPKGSGGRRVSPRKTVPTCSCRSTDEGAKFLREKARAPQASCRGPRADTPGLTARTPLGGLPSEVVRAAVDLRGARDSLRTEHTRARLRETSVRLHRQQACLSHR